MGSDSDGGGPRSGRRGFFRLGLKRMREQVVDALEAVAQAQQQPQKPQRPGPIERDGRRYHKVRTMTGLEDQDDADGELRPMARRLIRPPGAIPERDFLAICTRCGRCGDACPEASIFKAGPDLGAHLEMTPMLNVDQRACYLCTSVPCAAACQSGALRPIPVQDIKLGTAVVFAKLCLNGMDRPCSVCVDACPFPQEALVLPRDEADELVRQADGTLPIPRVDESHCPGCGLCVLHCKAYPKALMVRPA